MNVLVLGATGYVGGNLVPRLIERGHSVRCLVRDRRKLAGKPWLDSVEILEGDVLLPESVGECMNDIHAVYYLIHSMAAGDRDFEELDRRAAWNVSQAASKAGVRRVVYLGGLGVRESERSPHLRSRHEVGDILREGSVPVTEFRAAVIVGPGSVSFEMIHYLVNRLPIMICPRWVYTRTQPIAIADVLRYLAECLEHEESVGRVLDIGGPQIITYQDMMLALAEVLGLRRWLIRVPVLTPRLSSYWVNLVTPIKASIARALVEGLRSETVCENSDAEAMFAVEPMLFKDALRQAVARYGIPRHENDESGSVGSDVKPNAEASQILSDRREIDVKASASSAYGVISSVGGNNGWYFADWLWRLRGLIDRLLGGPGIRRGRKHPVRMGQGDTIDFWRAVLVTEGSYILLKAEMKVWGQAWLEFEIEEKDSSSCLIRQTAMYYPKGVVGLAYWYAVYPIHAVVFRGLIKAIGRRVEAATGGMQGT